MSLELRRMQLGSLECLVAGTLSPASKVVLLLHGFGANEQDFPPILPYLKNAPGYSWIFPRAPLELDLGFGQQGYAWYPLRISELQKDQNTGGMSAMVKTALEGFDSARKKIEDLISETKIPFSQWTLSGFSQGSTVALDVLLRHQEQAAGVGIFSGTYVKEAGWDVSAKAKPGQRYLITHGRQDAVLRFSFSEELNETFIEAGWQGEFIPFSGGHEFPPLAIEAFDRLLQKAPS